MGRVQLFEWEDLAWFPAVLRDAATAFLRRAIELTGFAEAISTKLERALAAAEVERIVDLCSGAAGPVLVLARAFMRQRRRVSIVLTDRYPNLPALEEAARSSAGAVAFESESVDATRVPERLRGMRTLFNAFHHFAPDEARGILGAAVAARQPIAVFELPSRHPATLVMMLLCPLGVLLTMPGIRPLRLSWLFFTYVLPLIPLLVLWDGLVSCFRAYSPAELKSLVATLPEDSFVWEVGSLPLRGGARATYLIGQPDTSVAPINRATDGPRTDRRSRRIRLHP